MPPQTRTRRTTALKENIGVENKLKVFIKSDKPTRKALADKTNSLSDDNESTDIPQKVKKTTSVSKKTILNNPRPRRQRRLPTRFVENNVLNNLSNSKDASVTDDKGVQAAKKDNSKTSKKQPTKTANIKSLKNDKPLNQIINPPNNSIPAENKQTSPFKTPSKDLESSLIANRPKRIHRLPSRFDDHSTSPNKFIPIQPCFASTPLHKKDQNVENVNVKIKPLNKDQVCTASRQKINDNPNQINHNKKRGEPNKKTVDKRLNDSNEVTVEKNKEINSSSPDTNNNPKSIRILRQKPKAVKTKSPSLNISPKKKSNGVTGKRLLDKNYSLKILENKEKSNKSGEDNLDVYEFTYDPEEEPPPQKKKRKRVVKTKTSKPKTFVFKSNYDDNVSKALNALKSKISKTSTQTVQKNTKVTQPKTTSNEQVTKSIPSKIVKNQTPKVQKSPPVSSNKVQIALQNQLQTETNNIPNVSGKQLGYDSMKNSVQEAHFPSIRIEDIAADFETSDNLDDINYSPVNSPSRPDTPNQPHQEINECLANPINNKDPLNLQADVSFFDDQPIASSSMNASVRHPLASPWRVEFGRLPIKWQVNTYVKPNMTPAVESSFINSENNNSQKKHVYTNMVAEDYNSLPQLVENRLKQTSMISFIKEVVERSASKKKRGRSDTPTKANSLFEDITNTTNVDMTPIRSGKKFDKNDGTPKKDSSNSSDDKSNEKENSKENRKRKNQNRINEIPAKSPRIQNNKDQTYFGFDDSENQDLENLSPSKHVHNLRVRGLKPRSRAVLQEINAQPGPMRAVLPVAAKSNTAFSSETVNKVYEDLKSAEDAPVLLNKKGITNIETINIDPVINEDEGADSVHLFEDIELLHHMKPTRKSYGKAKKVAFRKVSNSDSDTQPSEVAEQSEGSVEDDLADLTFTIPTMKEKKATKKKKTKKQLSKKEEQEVEAWAAGFNSMCEDVDEFDLVVE